jgi:diguanylate cyclase (GGDEF)-like protein
MTNSVRDRLLVVLTVVAIGSAVWIAQFVERSNTRQADREQSRVAQLLTGMLDQETGLRGYALTGDGSFLAPYREGTREFSRALSRLNEDRDPEIAAATDPVVQISLQWQQLAQAVIDRVRARGPGDLSIASSRARKAKMDSFRVAHARLRKAVQHHGDFEATRGAIINVAVIAVLGAALGGFGLWFVQRNARAAAARRVAEDRRRAEEDARRAAADAYAESQGEFTEMMQVTRGEEEANELLHRHLERTIADSSVVVLQRNNSKNRLEAATRLPPATVLGEKLAEAEPESCLAVRLGRPYERAEGKAEPLMRCGICGAAGPGSTCVPSLVGGEVIGSVLVLRGGELTPSEHERVEDSVARASPVLANLRNFAIARMRASTDALTGLPNARAVQENLKRMIAQASRRMAPLAATIMDLDHFKQVNDLFGHGKGDEVLAAAGQALNGTIRASDFVGRYGGEEFVILQPDTDQDGALVLAEKLRTAIGGLDVSGVERPISASFGIATFPRDAVDAETLFRAADRALHAAKSNGRNRVEVVASAPAVAEN